MKRLLVLALLFNQAAMASELSKLVTGLGKVYRESLEVEAQSAKQEELKKQITSSLSASVVKITLLPLQEIKLQFESLGLSFKTGAQGYSELEVGPSEALPALSESLRFQALYGQYELELGEAESKLTDIFYNTSPYRAELETLQSLRAPLQEQFSGATNMSEGHFAMESMFLEFAQLGFRWDRRFINGRVQFVFDQAYFQKNHQVTSPAFLGSKQKILTQMLQGPVKKLNYLRSVHSYISKRLGLEEFDSALRELIGKLR